MKLFYLTKKLNSIVSTILILLGIKEENVGVTTTTTTASVIHFDTRNRFGLYSFKAALVFLIMVMGTSVSSYGQTTLITASNGGFEGGPLFADSGWTVVNAATNTWRVGTASTAFAGSNAAYISNNSGTTWAYTNTTSQTSHFYRDIAVPAGETNISLSFQWKGGGESGFDRLLVYTAPTSVTPAANAPVSSSTAITNATLVFTQPSFTQTSYTTATVTLPASLAGTTFRLIFTWQNDGSGGTGTASVDNIALTSATPINYAGTYTINNSIAASSSNFISFTSFINALNVGNITGAITVNVSAGQTFAELPPAMTFTGTSTNTITIQKSGSGANPRLTPTGIGSTDGGFIISGGDYITFDGIDVDGSAATNSTNAIEYGYLVRNASAINGAQFNTIRNVAINLGTRAFTNTSYAIFQTATSTGGGVTATNATGANSSNKYYNFTISNARNGGVYLLGASSTIPDLNCEIGTTACATRNSITNIGATVSTFTGAEGIRADFQSGVKIFNNNISAIASDQSAGRGIYFLSCLGNNEIYGNNVQNISVKGSTTTTSIATGIEGSLLTTGTNNVRIYNNYISNIFTSNATTATATIYAYGMFTGVSGASTSQSYDIDNNNISIGQGLTPTYTNACFGIQNGSPIIRVRGNIFANFTGAQTGIARHVCSVVTAAGLGGTGTAFDYNDYFYSNATNAAVGRSTSTTYYNTLADWKTFTTGTLDETSVAVDPVFADNNTNLATSNTALNAVSGFTPQAWVTSDIQCNVRADNTPNDLGAFAFNPPATPIISSFNLANICATGGQTVTITGSNFSAITAVQFNGVNATSFNVVSTTSITAVTPANLAEGFITVTNGVGTGTSPTTYTPRPTPATPTVSTAGTYCTSTTLSADNGSDGTMYWQNTTPLGVSTATPSASQLVNTVGTNTYYFRAQSSFGCWSAAGSAAVTIAAPIAITTNVNTTLQTRCVGVAATALSVVVTGTTPTYQWYSNTANDTATGTLIASATSASYTPPTTAAGTTYYYCIISSVAPCSSAVTSAVATVTVNAAPTITGTLTACLTGFGSTRQLTGSGTPNATTPWASSATAVATVSSTGLVTSVALGSTTITYTDDNGCATTANVSVNAIPAAVTATAAPATLCSESPINLTSSFTAFPTTGMDLYAASRTTGASYTSIFPGTTITTWRNTVNTTDDNLSDNQPIGFSFNYNGTNYTTFRVSTNGFLTFDNSNAATGGGTGAYGYSNSFTNSNPLILAPNWDDLQTAGNLGTIADLDNSINYTTTGSSPNRVLTVEWKNMQDFNTTSTASYNWQVKLYEADGRIEFVYGTMTQSAAAGSLSASTGISAATVSSTPTAAQLLCQTTANSNTFGFTNATTLGNVPAANTMISFVRTLPTAIYSWTGPNSFASAVANPSIASATSANSGVYNLVVSNSITGCQGTASTASVTVNDKPTVVIDTPTATICSGGSGVTLTASGSSTYAWRIGAAANFATTAATTVNPTANTTYTVRGTDASGCFSEATATVSVNTAIGITTQPNNAIVLENAPANFSVVATGTNPTYQWQVYNTTTSDWDNLSGETAATYAIASAGTALSGSQYRCIVSGTAPCAPVTSAVATLTVSNVSITAQPAAQTVCSSSNAVFSVSTTGAVTTTQWQLYNTTTSAWEDISGETGTSLTLTGLTAADTGKQYRVLINGGTVSGGVNSDPATLTVFNAVSIGTQPVSQAACAGGASVSFSVGATGSNLTYQWQFSTNGGSNWNPVSGATDATYTINAPAFSLHNNQYRVVVSGAAQCSSQTSDAVTLTVTNVEVAASSSTVCLGDPVTLTATFSETSGTQNASWVSATTGSGATTAVTGNPATITPTATGSFTYSYSTNGTCTFSRTVSITVNTKPTITSATATPTSVCSGGTINLAAASIPASAGTASVGLGATTSATYSNPFYSAWSNNHTQYLITASELTAAGLTTGNITSVALNVTSAGTLPMIDLSVKIGTSTATAMTAFVSSAGFQTVYNNASLLPTTGVNTLTFSSPFFWNGTSNIVLEFCHGNASSSSTMSRTVQADNTTYVSTVKAHVSSATSASTVCGNTTSNLVSYSLRPRFYFGGQVGTNQTANFNWSWNSSPAVTTATGTTSVTNTGAEAITQTFTATATNPTTGCFITLAAPAVTVNATIPTPTATNSSHCGSQTPTCSVTGTGRVGNTFRWYTVSTNGTAIAGQTASTLSNYAVGTLGDNFLYVSEVSPDGLCESARVTVTVTVTAPGGFTLSSATATNCNGSPSTTPVTINTNEGAYTTYTWNNAATVSGNETTGWFFAPTATTTYTLTASGGTGGCSTTAQVVVTPTALPVVTVATPATVCEGTPVTLTALTTGIGSGTATLGSGTLTSSSVGASMFPGSWGGAKSQYIITASSLNSLGYVAGNLTSLAFEPTTSGQTYQGFTVSLGLTTNSAATSTFLPVGTQVFAGTETDGGFTPTANVVNTLAFGTGVGSASTFAWNGTSNLVVTISWSRVPSASTSTASTVKYYAPGFTCGTYVQVDSVSPATLLATATGTTTTSSPIFTLAGQRTIQTVGTLTYSWNDPLATAGNVLTLTPPSGTTVYRVTATDPATTCARNVDTTVTVTPIPTAPTATNGARCNAGVVTTATVADNNSFTTPTFKWYADNVTTTALQTSTSTSYTTSISTTTTLWVSVVGAGCESARTPITLTINTPATLTVPATVTVCTGANAAITASGGSSYTWSPATDLSATTGATVTTTPTASIVYTLNGTDSNGCTMAPKTVNVIVAPYPSAITITPGAASVCTNAVMSLTASGATYTVASSGTATIGTDNATTKISTDGVPYRTGTTLNNQVRNQYLFTAAELASAGITAGNINSLTFVVNTGNTGVMSNLTFRMANTTSTAITSTFLTPTFTTVLTLPTYTSVVGDNNHTFTTPFVWDGTSNVVVETCGTLTTAGLGCTMATFTTTGITTVGTSTSTGCTATTGTTVSNARPVMKFGYATSTATQGTFTWSPNDDLYTTIAATTGYTGGATAQVFTKPSTTRNYTVTSSNGSCSTTATFEVVPVELPTFTVADATICNGETTILAATGTGNNYAWTPTTGLSAGTGSSVDANPTATTTYSVQATSIGTGCQSTLPVTVTVNQPPVVTSITPTSNAIRPTQNATYTVAATGTGLTFQWQINDGSGWSDLADEAGVLSGSLSAQLSVLNVTTDYNDYLFRCVVSGLGTCAPATSDSAILKVDVTGIDAQPTPQTVCAGTPATFSITASSDDPEQTISYTWQYRIGSGSYSLVPLGFDSVTGLTYSNIDTATLSMTGTATTQVGLEFRCVVNSFIFSSAASLTVVAPLTIGTHPADATICAGGSATLTAAATGTSLGYQWEFSTNGGTSYTNYTGTGATTASITVSPTVNTLYRLVVSGNSPCGAVTTNAATVSVNSPAITSSPVASTIFRGESTTFGVTATSASTYKWQRSATLNGTYTDVVDGDAGTGVTYSNQGTATLTVTTTLETPTGSANFYRCVVSNTLNTVTCTATSTGAQLTINGYCTPTAGTVATSYFDSFSTTGGTTNITNSASAYSTNGYGNFTATQTVTQILGGTVNYNTTLVGTTVGVAIWVDWNRNGTFETTERVANTTGYVSTFSGSFAVPMTATVGTTRMRILMDYNTSNPANPCGPFAFGRGEVEDYTFVVNAQPVCTQLNLASAVASVPSTSLCQGASSTLSVTGLPVATGFAYQWYSTNGTTETAITTAGTSATYATGNLTEGTYGYFCELTCSGGAAVRTNTITLTVANPLLTSTTPNGRCGTGSVQLQATATGGNVNWYAALTGGSPLAGGTNTNTFNTPSISTNTTYYAEATSTGATIATGRTAPESTANDWWTGYGLQFNAASNIRLNSVQVYPVNTSPAAMTIRLLNSSGVQVSGTSDVIFTPISNAVGDTAQTVNLGYNIPAGTGYRLVISSGMSSSNKLVEEGSIPTLYPITNGPVTITANWEASSATSDYYNWFYNWNVDTNLCSSARTAVLATVNPTIAATISYSGSPFCSTSATRAVTRTGTTGGTYSATPAGLNINATTGLITVAGSTPGTYTIAYDMAASTFCPAAIATTTITINQAPTSGFAYSGPYCTTSGTVSPTLTGAAGTFTSSPAGLSINSATGDINTALTTPGTYNVTNTVTVAGCTNSVTTVAVVINNAVTVTSNPSNVAVLPAATNITFTVAATGTGLGYQWQTLNSVDTGWTNVQSSTLTTVFTGFNSATLTLDNAGATGLTGAQFRCLVSGAAPCSTATSGTATITVSSTAITQHPANGLVCTSGTTTVDFTVVTTGDTPTYNWQVYSNEYPTFTNIASGVYPNGTFSNETTATLTVSYDSSLTGIKFRCSLNSDAILSNEATLTQRTAVSVSAPPVATSACSGGGASFSVTAAGSGLSYQWQVSTNGGTSFSNTGTNSNSLSLSSITTGMNNNQYQVIVSGAAPCSAVTTTPVVLTVNTVVAVTTQPAGVTVCPNAPASFTVAASGTNPTYQWQMSTNGTTWSEVSGATSATLNVSGVSVNTQYRAVVSGTAPCASVNSNAATLTISQPAAPIITPLSSVICAGATQALTVSNPIIGTTTLGTAAITTSTAGITPFSSVWEGSRIQYLIRASELTTQGLTAGDLNSIAFNVSTVGGTGTTQKNYSIKLGATSTNAFAASPVFLAPTGGFTTVYSIASLAAPTSGLNTLTFSTPYNWDGTSNILVEICHDNDTNASCTDCYTTSATVRATTTTYRSVFGRYADNIGMCSATTTGTAISSFTTRPDITFGRVTGTTWATDGSLYSNAGATTLYTSGQALATVYAKPTAETTYTATNTNALGCTNTSSVTLSLTPVPTLGGISQPLITCSGEQTTFNVSGLLPNSTSTLTYTINNVNPLTVTGVVADGSGNASFTLALAGFTNGQTLRITTVQRTDVATSCSSSFSTNNSVTINVQSLVTYYRDFDGDTFGDSATFTITCQGQPVGYVTNATDCDDNDATKNATFTFYVDNDGDGYGAGSPFTICAINANTPPSGYSANSADCDDNNASLFQTTGTSTATACTSYLWAGPIGNNNTYTASGSYTYTTANAAGCANVQTLVLTINSVSSGTTTASACDSYVWAGPLGDGQTYTSTPTTAPTFVSLNAAGCDHTQTLNLTITASTTGTTTAIACDSYVWSGPLGDGQTYTESNSTATFVSGCNTQTLNLTINNSTTNATSVTACDTYTWSVNSTAYTASGTYTATSTNAAGCPLTEILNLTINNSTSNATTATACDTYTWSVNSTAYTASGTYTATSTNAAGCTHTETLNLTINNSTSNTTTATACDTYTWTAGNGNTYTESGSYTYVNGCDTQTLALTITPSTSGTTTASACDTYTWTAGNGNTYTESGSYTYVNGCHTQTLVLTISP